MTARGMTIIQTPEGEVFGLHNETVENAISRLERAGWLVQRIDNVVRLVRRMKG